MDTFAKLITCVILGAFYAPTVSAYEFHDPFPNVKVIDGDLHIQRPGGGTSLAYPNAGISKEIPVNTSKGQFLIPVEKSLPVLPSKVGKAATRFVRSLPLIATGLAIYDTLCDLSDICSATDGSGNLVKLGPDPIVSSGGDMTTGVCNFAQPDQTVYFNYTTSGYEGAGVYALYRTRLSPGCTGFTPPAGMTLHSFCPAVPGSGCGSSQMYRKKQSSVPPRTETPIIESDWTEAETKLNAQPQQTVEALYNSDAPVPVTTGTQLAPITKTVTSSTTQIKDEHGNTVGTQVQTTNITVTDTSTTNNISFNITETTITENYDDQNQLIGSTETQSSNEPPKPPPTEPTTIEFDNLPPDQLQEESVSLDPPDPGTWGEGVCPGDVDLGIYGLTISYQPACDAAAMLRPIFITLSSITALLIMAGVSIRGGE